MQARGVAPAVTLDSLSGAAGFVGREWGDYGYRVALVGSDFRGGGVFEVRHVPDGHCGYVSSDQYGNAAHLADAEVAV